MLKCALLQKEKKNPTRFRKMHLKNVLARLCVCEMAGDHKQREETKIKKQSKCRRYDQSIIYKL